MRGRPATLGLAALVACGGGGGTPSAPDAGTPSGLPPPPSALPPPPSSGSVTSHEAPACKLFLDLQIVWRLQREAEETGDTSRWATFFWAKVNEGACGYFLLRDEIEWTEEERPLPDDPTNPLILVFGTPLTGPQPSRTERSLWWIAKSQTSLGAAPPPGSLQPLSWLDAPTEPVTVRVGAERAVTLRLAESVSAKFTIKAPRVVEVRVVGEDTSPTGTLDLVVTGVAVGTATVGVIAEAVGYRSAETSFEVTVEPAQALRWLDVPVEPVTVGVGQQRTVTLRLSEPVSVQSTRITLTETGAVAASPSSPRRGVLDVVVTGLRRGAETITLVVEPPGYEPAETSFGVTAVSVGFVIYDAATVCLEFSDLETTKKLEAEGVAAGHDFTAVGAFFDAKVDEGLCARFAVGDEIDWTGEERTIEAVDPHIPAIRVYGMPRTGPEDSRSERKLWWMLRNDASFPPE